MSVINGLYYQHLRSSIGFTVSGTTVYATLPWHPQSTIDEIRVTNTAGTAFTITALNVLDAGAHYRNSTTDGKAHVIYRDPTDKNATSNEAYWTSYELNPPVFHDNLYNRPYLNLVVSFTESKTNIPLRITATGKKAVATTYAKSDHPGLEILRDYRVLMGKGQSGTGGTGGAIYDVTGLAKGTGGENSSNFNFSAVNDYLYVGSKSKVDHWDFQVGTATTGGTNLIGELWTGSAWSAFTVLDDTSTGNNDTLKFSGVVEGLGIGTSTWSPVKFDYSVNTLLPNDPLTVQQNRIISGGYPIVVLPPNPERYWVRFRVQTIDTPITFNKILPVSETYELY